MKTSPYRRPMGAATVLAAAFLLCAAASFAAMVDVDVLGDDRGVLPEYRIVPRGHYTTHRAYVQALEGERYSVRVKNNSADRIGVVIAVDGRNIISGKKSNLRPDERMYILPPYGSGTYEGWRTERDTVNRFYFTDPGDSYAGAFGDRSAMGVIALAVYREKRLPREKPLVREIPEREFMDRAPEPLAPGKGSGVGRPPAPQAAAPGPGAAGESAAPRSALRKGDDAGTGFGEETYSPARKVEFRADPRVAERHFLKYEWRETLCRKGIIDCRWPKNRFWDDDDDYAPYPPGRDRNGD
ncbi:MAG: hypothetical protein C4529_00020 [Deltaproteobacteria bacterium]|nr:MAG: hypothetical protein C4529_00020 [Deltaproteobacteria bacterium]